MEELQVKASRILVVQKGDTLVYNADMLRLAAGAMLDDLINALPHAAIDRDGLITVKGEPIKELLIEGWDFFQGDPSVALKNLPAFTVHKVKVYRRMPRDAYLTRKAKGKKALATDLLVMDVRLKAKYQNGVLANLESASGVPTGSADRYLYLDRLFVLHYNERRSISAYAGMNNVNDDGEPHSGGIWRGRQSPNSAAHVTYTGLLSEERLADWYQIADIGILPSFTEQSSYSGIEMLAYGKLIVTTDGHNLTDMFNDGTAIIAPIGEHRTGDASPFADSLVNAVQTAFSIDEATRQEYRGRASAHYDLFYSFNQWKTTYTRLING